jgi:hypothetical protein
MLQHTLCHAAFDLLWYDMNSCTFHRSAAYNNIIRAQSHSAQRFSLTRFFFFCCWCARTHRTNAQYAVRCSKPPPHPNFHCSSSTALHNPLSTVHLGTTPPSQEIHDDSRCVRCLQTLRIRTTLGTTGLPLAAFTAQSCLRTLRMQARAVPARRMRTSESCSRHTGHKKCPS